MNAKIKQIDGLALVGHADTGHWVAMDAPHELGGLAAGSRPMELVLMGIAGCAAMDIIAILVKKRVKLDGFELDVHALRQDEHPQIFTKITLNYTFIGHNIQPKDIERAIELTDEKYCGAIEMVRDVTEIVHEYETKESESRN